MTTVQLGHGALILFACVGAAAGAVAASVPSLAVPGGAVSAACIAIVGVLGRYLPSASPATNATAVAAVTARGTDVTIAGTK